jgi:hypothetical protein
MEKTLALLGLTALGISWFWRPETGKVSRSLIGLTLPMQSGALVRTESLTVDPLVRGALPTADISRTLYTLPSSGEGVELTLIAGSDRDALHDPRSCMVGAGWRIENDRVEPLAGTGTRLRRCTLAQGAQRFDVVYGYVCEGNVLAEPTQIRGRMLTAAVLGRKDAPVCFFRLLRPAGRIPDTTFEPFAAALWNALDLEKRF